MSGESGRNCNLRQCISSFTCPSYLSTSTSPVRPVKTPGRVCLFLISAWHERLVGWWQLNPHLGENLFTHNLGAGTLISITAAHMHLTRWLEWLYGWLALHIHYKLCKCSLMPKTDRGAEGTGGTINQHLCELPHFVWPDVYSQSQRRWMQISQHLSCFMTVGVIVCFTTTRLRETHSFILSCPSCFVVYNLHCIKWTYTDFLASAATVALQPQHKLKYITCCNVSNYKLMEFINCCLHKC